MKAKASICISQDDTLIESLEIAKSRIQIMIGKGMDNDAQVLQAWSTRRISALQKLIKRKARSVAGFECILLCGLCRRSG